MDSGGKRAKGKKGKKKADAPLRTKGERRERTHGICQQGDQGGSSFRRPGTEATAPKAWGEICH